MKAILVMDMPENCITCPLCNGNDECLMQDENANFAADTISELMNGCPLVQTPDLEARVRRTAQPPTITAHRYVCPRCRTSRNINQKYAFCPNCGQRLAWEQLKQKA